MDKTVKEIVRIAKMKNFTKDDLIQESECVDKYENWQAKVRQTLQINSCFKNKAKGIWGMAV